MNKKQALEYIETTSWKDCRPGNSRMRALMKALGDPQNGMKFVHVAGTNGKGSTCAMIASVLQAAGYRTGLYVSPHLAEYNERICIDGRAISDSYFCSLAERVFDAAAGGADRVLEMACVGGARVMGLDDCDDIAPGKRADLIVLNLQRPNMQPEHNIPRNIVYAGSKENVRMTMVNGRVLYENGEFFIGEEPRTLYEKANAMAREITA